MQMPVPMRVTAQILQGALPSTARYPAQTVPTVRHLPIAHQAVPTHQATLTHQPTSILQAIHHPPAHPCCTLAVTVVALMLWPMILLLWTVMEIQFHWVQLQLQTAHLTTTILPHMTLAETATSRIYSVPCFEVDDEIISADDIALQQLAICMC